MRSRSLFVALLFAFATGSYALENSPPHLAERKQHHGNGTMDAGTSINRECRQMAKLTKITELAANQTKLDAMVAKGKLDAAGVDKIKQKAANATTELQTLQSNTTLVQECQVVDAHQKVVGECKAMKKLEKLANMANNQTAMLEAIAQKKGLNDTQLAKLQQRIASATAKLQDMKGNTTLTDLCAKEVAQKGAQASGKRKPYDA